MEHFDNERNVVLYSWRRMGKTALITYPLFSGYTKLLTNMQWKVLMAVAKDEPLINPLSKEFINNYHLGATSSVNTALRMLQKNELVIEDEGSYFVHDVLLARWLQSL